jgi:tRNA dimethylallyltransferase
MWAAGLVDEARELLAHGLGVTAGRAIGYAQAIAELSGEISEAEAIERTSILTRKYARRQVSWFTRYPQVTWLDHDDPARIDIAMALLHD